MDEDEDHGEDKGTEHEAEHEDGDAGDEESDEEEDENEDDEEFHIRDIIAWRTVGTKHPQEQFKVQWEDWDDSWHTEEELLAEPCKWKLAEPYHDRKVLRSKLTWVRSNTRHTQNKG